MVSTLICCELTRKSSTHRGCRIPLRKKRDSAPTRYRPNRSRGHRWRRWTGPGTPGTCTRTRTGTTGRCCRGYLSACPAASPAAGPRRSGAYSPGGGSAAPRPPWGRCRDRWTRTCARRACTGCSRRRSARRPPGSRRPLLRRDGQTSRLAFKLNTATVTVQKRPPIGCPAMHARTHLKPQHSQFLKINARKPTWLSVAHDYNFGGRIPCKQRKVNNV